MWPGYFKNELHIGYVTNGVHFPTWIATNLRRLYARYFADGFEGHAYDIPAWQKVHNIPDGELWAGRMHLKNKLIKHIRKRYSDPSQVRLDSPRQMLQVIEASSPTCCPSVSHAASQPISAPTCSSRTSTACRRSSTTRSGPCSSSSRARRTPTTSRGRISSNASSRWRPCRNSSGKFSSCKLRHGIGAKMVQGVDVWLNTPTRPLEASGTSGEKCVMNGVLQFSVLDGWWVEGYKEGAGWMLPMERTFADQHYQDELDAEMIYNTIEEQIVPKYYDREQGRRTPRMGWSRSKKCVADIASNSRPTAC